MLIWVLCVLGGVVGHPAMAWPLASDTVATAKWIVTGTLQEADGSPASGVEVFLFPHKNGSLLHGIGLKDGKFGLSNPGTKTDPTGRFRIELGEAYLREQGTEDFAVGLFEPASPAHPAGQARPLRDMDRGQALPLFNVSVFKKARTLELNELFKKIVVE